MAASAYVLGQSWLVPLQTSSTSHGLPVIAGLQTLPRGRGVAPGQSIEVPSQTPRVAHEPMVEPPQATPGAIRASPGHACEVPLQRSSASQGPSGARHGVSVGAASSFGHAASAPVQWSSTSQGEALGRQTVAAERSTSGGHAALVLTHTSTSSQSPAAGRHVTVGALAAESVAHVPSALPVSAALHA